MDCREFAAVAGALLEGENLPAAHNHLASCPGCRLWIGELAAIERVARTLPTHEPGPGLWDCLQAAAIEEGLWSEPAWKQWLGPAWNFLPARPAFAAVLSVVLLFAVALVSYPTLDLPVALPAPASPFEVAQGELVQEASYATRYQVHLNNVEHQVLGAESPADAELRELVARPLDAVDRAIEETQLRLTHYPEDTLTRQELHRLYQQKVVVLQAMTDPAWLEMGR